MIWREIRIKEGGDVWNLSIKLPFFVSDAKDLKAEQEDVPQLMRTRSDVGVRRRGNLRTPSEQRRLKRHRFSINGHFYNHKVSPDLPWRTPQPPSLCPFPPRGEVDNCWTEIFSILRLAWCLTFLSFRLHAQAFNWRVFLFSLFKAVLWSPSSLKTVLCCFICCSMFVFMPLVCF